MQKPKPQKLSHIARQALDDLAMRLVEDIGLRVAVEAAEVELRAATDALLDRLFPERDMKVLARYGFGTIGASLRVHDSDNRGLTPPRNLPSDRVDQRRYDGRRTRHVKARTPTVQRLGKGFASEQLHAENTWVLPRASRLIPNERVAVARSDRDVVEGAWIAWHTALVAYDNALLRKLNDYATFVRQSETWEDVLAVWPEAARIRGDFQPGGRGAIVRYDPELVKRIKSDVAERQEQAREADAAADAAQA